MIEKISGREDIAIFFAPEDIAIIVIAFDEARDALRLTHREDKATLLASKGSIAPALHPRLIFLPPLVPNDAYTRSAYGKYFQKGEA
jgi:hypothetical protein